MKLISATIKPVKLDPLLETIQKYKNIIGLNIVHSHGFEHISHFKEDDLLEMKPYVKIEITVHDDAVDYVHNLIIEAVYTGISGDGRISILPVESCFRIASKKYL